LRHNNSSEIKSNLNATSWETRNKLTDGFADSILEQNRAKDWLSAQASANFSSIQLT
jgi:hypothetical protein